ncbi:MAG: polymer-forming cytoskeletal protein [Terracidiphilus sp.]|nr:polymer-forming cytoskeletal protein [Terracidiphilus sp.]MDR3776375.1 polymer-forming cytoskeletal protein [Terracidiphilus sp.]
MWKSNETGSPSFSPSLESARPMQSTSSPESAARPAAVSTGDQANIGKGLVITGEISGSESLLIDGKVEGKINLPGNRVTVGRNGKVNASIVAREIVVLGKVRGNLSASDRVDIRAEGALSGDVACARISIEDGAFFKGGIDIRKPEAKTVPLGAVPTSAHTPAPEPDATKPTQS